MRQKKMSRSEQRKFLESRLEDLREIYTVQNVAEVPGKKGIWEIEQDNWKFYRIGEERLVVLIQERLVPVLYKNFNPGIDISLPSLVVDRGAVPHISNGADVMRPGVVMLEGSFKKGSLVSVKDQTYRKILAMAEALEDSERINAAERGKIAKNLHHVGDKVWSTVASIAGRMA